MVDYKKTCKCKNCNNDDYRVLEFHHIKNKDKDMSMGDILNNRKCIKAIKKEVEKCVILCANCHRIIHYKKEQ